MWKALTLVLLMLALAVGVSKAHACACCTNAGQRRVGLENLDAGKIEELRQIKFGARARLFTGEGDAADTKGIIDPQGEYQLDVALQGPRWAFTFRTGAVVAGTLTLILPPAISIFEVDPRPGAPDAGSGPLLYKEWSITSPAFGTGNFHSGTGREQRLTLILHGEGNSCTSAGDFRHWTMQLAGPGAEYRLFGDLR